MKSIIKISLFALGGIAVLALIVIAAFALLFDPNALRDDITRIVADKTGRELVIEGELSLSFYPWLGFAAGRTTVSNAPGFEEPYMLRFENASASVKLLPLISRRVELSQVTLNGVDLNLTRKADGTSNWDDLTALNSADGAAADGDSGGFSAQGVGGLKLTNVNLTYVDKQAGSSYSARDLRVETGALKPGKPVGLDAEGYLVSVDPALEGPATLKGEIALDDAGDVTMTDAVFVIDASGESIPGDELKIRMEGSRVVMRGDTVEVSKPKLFLNGTAAGGDPWNSLEAAIEGPTLSLVDYDQLTVAAPTMTSTLRVPAVTKAVEVRMSGTQLKASIDKQTAVVDTVSVDTMGMKITSAIVNGTSIFDALTLSARIDVAEFEPRKLLAQVGADDITTADPQAMAAMTVSGEARYGPDAVGLRNMSARLDQSNITGSASYTEAGQMRFDLVVDEVNIDRYRAPAEDAQAGAAAGVEEVVIPVEELRALNIDGKLRVGQMRLVGLVSSDVNITIKAKDGDIRVNPASASLYGGAYMGDIGLDVRGALPVLSLNERLENVQFGPFSKDLLDADRLSGTLSGRLTATGAGPTASEITASTNGDVIFAFKDGAYEGTDVWYNVRRARALIKGEAAPAQPAEKRTRFADLSGTAKIVDGVMSSDDVSMIMPFMKVSGAGKLELLSQQLDFRFRGQLVDRPELTADVNDLVGVTIPIKITGAVSDPSVAVDMKAVLADLAKRKLGEKLGLTTKDGEQAEPEDVIDEKKQELEDKLKDKLKGLFGGGG